MTAAFHAGQRAVPAAQIVRALQTNNRDVVENAIRHGLRVIEDRLTAALSPELFRSVLAAGANVAARQQRRDLRALAEETPVGWRFDRTNPQAVAWAEAHAAELVTELTTETRTAVRQLIVRAFNEGIPPRVAAKMLKQSVGLTTGQTESVAKLRQRLAEGAGKTVKAGKLRFRVPEGGFSLADQDRALARYAERLTKQRAVNIARTETMRASNEGQRQLWQQQVANGNLTGREQRVWITANPCPQCAPLEGALATIEGDFPGGFANPPLHPSCRCTTGLVAAETPKAGDEPGLDSTVVEEPSPFPLADTAIRRFKPDDARRQGEQFTAWRQSLSDAERDAIRRYSVGDFDDINAYLRGELAAAEAESSTLVNDIDLIRAALNRASGPPPEVVWRGLKGKDAAKFVNSLEPGTTIELKGFQSTTLNPEVATKRLREHYFEIVPKRGGYIAGVDVGGFETEFEFLLLHGEEYRVLGVKTVQFEVKGAIKNIRVVQLQQL